MGLFQPILTLAQKSPKLTPRPGNTRAGAKQPTLYISNTHSLKALCDLVPLDFLASWPHWVATWGQDARMTKLAISGGRPGLAFSAIPSSQLLIHGP